jgi:fucose permease
MAQRLIGRDRGIGFGNGTDFPGAVLITGALMLGVYTIVKPAAEQGWGSAAALGLGAASLALLAAFIAREATAANPLVPLRIFRSRNVSGANIVQALLVAGMFGMFFMGALYLERVLGYDPLEIGLAFLPTTLVMGTLSLRYSERLITIFGARRSLVTGMVFIAAGLALFARVPVDANYVVDVLPSLIVLGAGVGVAFPSLMTLAMSGATQEDAGLASGLVNTTAQVGGALGLAVLATLSTTRTESLLERGESTASALTGGYHLAFLIGAALVVAAIVVGLTVIERPQRQEQAQEKTSGRTEPAYGEAA